MNKSTHDKGTFLQNFYGVKEIPDLVDKDGNPTKFAEAAKYWGEEVPKTKSDVKQLVAKGAALTATQNFSVSQKVNNNSIWGGKQKLSLLRDNRIKVPFVKTGSWKHDTYGEVSFTEEDINQLISNYNEGLIGFTPYLTYGHLDEEPDSTDSHRKRGDLQSIVVEPGDTDDEKIGYGIFDVDDELYNSIQKGEYEYSSGEFNRMLTRKDTGDTVGTAVIRVALTNSPFLPFGDHKIQALSSNTESCPENKENYVFSLSIDAVKEDASTSSETTEVKETNIKESETANPDKDIETITKLSNTENNMDKLNNTTSAVEEKVVETASDSKEELTNTVNQATKTEEAKPVATTKEVEATVAKSVKEDTSKADINPSAVELLTSQLAKIEETYKSQIDAANKIIQGLGDKVDSLTSQLNSQAEVTQAFSNSMSVAQEKALISHLQANNVQPALVQQFLSFKKGLTKDNTVKLSVTAGEETKVVEQNVVEAVAEMLISASNQAPLVEQQLGVSAGRKTGAFNFSGIIERNKEAASKVKV